MAQQGRIGKHATSVFSENGETMVKYHNTVVVKFDSDRIVLDTGGWESATTKTRMNQASRQFDLGYTVYQRDFDWFVSYKGEEVPFAGGFVTLKR